MNLVDLLVIHLPRFIVGTPTRFHRALDPVDDFADLSRDVLPAVLDELSGGIDLLRNCSSFFDTETRNGINYAFARVGEKQIADGAANGSSSQEIRHLVGIIHTHSS